MGRPKQALISRRKTLEVALKVIDEEGLEALSMRRLGEELNVSGISLYHHFKSKEHILVGVCELALADVRTPNTTSTDWREWLVDNCRKYYRALRAHPNLIPILMRRHPLRIGLAEHNATAGLLAVQGVPIGAIMPLMEITESIALGCASYQCAVEVDRGADNWQEANPVLHHVMRSAEVSWSESFEAMATAAMDAILAAYHAKQDKGQDPPEVKSKPAANARSRRGRP